MSLINHVNMMAQSVAALKLPKRKTLTNLFEAVNENGMTEIHHQLENLSGKKLNTSKRIFGGLWTILTFAVYKGDEQTVRRLLLMGANVNKAGWGPRLNQTIGYGIAQHPHDLDRVTYYPLILAIDRLNITLVKLLLKHGADVNVPVQGEHFYEEEGGFTQYKEYTSIFNKAVCTGSNQLVQVILQQAGKVNLVDRSGLSSLDVACGSSRVRLKVIQHLVAYGAKTTYKKGDFINNSFGSLIAEMFTDNIFEEEVVKAKQNIEAIQLILSAEYNYQGSTSHIALHDVYQRMSPELDVAESEVSLEFYQWAQFVKAYLRMPSSLAQIARTCVRNSLGQKCRPETIERLPLPEPMIRYIKLDI